MYQRLEKDLLESDTIGFVLPEFHRLEASPKCRIGGFKDVRFV